jgi:hypothetical protein
MKSRDAAVILKIVIGSIDAAPELIATGISAESVCWWGMCCPDRALSCSSAKHLYQNSSWDEFAVQNFALFVFLWLAVLAADVVWLRCSAQLSNCTKKFQVQLVEQFLFVSLWRVTTGAAIMRVIGAVLLLAAIPADALLHAATSCTQVLNMFLSSPHLFHRT